MEQILHIQSSREVESQNYDGKETRVQTVSLMKCLGECKEGETPGPVHTVCIFFVRKPGIESDF